MKVENICYRQNLTALVAILLINFASSLIITSALSPTNQPTTNNEEVDIDYYQFAQETHVSVKSILTFLAKLIEANKRSSNINSVSVGDNLKLLYKHLARQNEQVAPFMQNYEKFDTQILSDEEILFYNYLEAALNKRYLVNSNKIISLKEKNHIDRYSNIYNEDKNSKEDKNLGQRVRLAKRQVQSLMGKNAHDLRAYSELGALNEQVSSTPTKLMDNLYNVVVKYRKDLDAKLFNETKLRKLLFDKCLLFALQKKYLVLNSDFLEPDKAPSRLHRPKKFRTLYDSRQQIW